MTHHQPQLGVGGSIAVVAMAVLSTGVAVWTASGMISCCIDAIQLRNSVLVEAKILNIEVIERGEAGDAVYFTYAYDYEGNHFQHRTRRVAVYSQSNEWHEQLRDAYREGNAVLCYVDPDKPSRSVFSKTFSISLFLVSSLFPIGFGSIAIILTTSLIRQSLQRKRDRRAV